MGLTIEDGTGSGREAGVNSENRLSVDAVSFSGEHHANHHDKQAYNVQFSQAPTANDDCIYYMQNTSDTDMVVEGMYLATSAACEVYVKVDNSGTRNSATALTPTNLNRGSGNEADGVFEKGADLDGGAATLTSGIEIARGVFHAALSTSNFNFEQDIILPKNSTLTIWCDTAATTITALVDFNSHSEES